MKGKMYLNLFIFWFIHLASSSSSGIVTSTAMTIPTTTASPSFSSDGRNSLRVHSVGKDDISTQIDHSVSNSRADSGRASHLVSSEQTRGIHPTSSISFQATGLLSTTSPSRSIQSSRAHFSSDQLHQTSMLSPGARQSMSVIESISLDSTSNTKPTTPLLATESLLSASSLDAPSFSTFSMVRLSSYSTAPSVSSSLVVTLPETDQLSGYFLSTRSMHPPASSSFSSDLRIKTALVDSSVTFLRGASNILPSEFGDTTILHYSRTSDYSTDTTQQTSPLPLQTVSLHSSISPAQESNFIVSSILLQPSTFKPPLSTESLSSSFSGSENSRTVLPGTSSIFETQQTSALLYQSSGSLELVESNSAAFETLHSASDTLSTVNSQSIMTSIRSSVTNLMPAVSLSASVSYSESPVNESIPSSILGTQESMLHLFMSSSMIESTVLDMSQFRSSVSEIWTSVSNDVTSSIVNDLSQMSSSVIGPSSQNLYLESSTQTFIGLDTSGVLYSSAIQSNPSFSSSEIPKYSDFATIMSSSVLESSTLCAHCSTFSYMNLNSTRLDSAYSLSSESSLQNRTETTVYHGTSVLSLHTSEVSTLPSTISSILFDSSTLEAGGSNDSVNTPSSLSPSSILSSLLDASLTNIDVTPVTMYENMSTPDVTTAAPPPIYTKNITLAFSLKGNCDFIMKNSYVFRKFWRSLLLYTEMASDLSIAQHDISLVETGCNPFRAVISISTDNNTINIAETISNYFHSNSSLSKISVQLNNGTKIEVIITQYQFIPGITGGSSTESKTPLSEIVVISVAAVICGVLIIIGLVIFIREYLQKRKSEGFRFPAESYHERVALRSLSRTTDGHGSNLEMKDAGSMSGAYNGPYESEYSTVGSQKGRRTDFMTRSDMSITGRSKTKGRRQLSTGQTTSSNGTARSQDTRGYGLVIGLLGYKPRSKEPADTYAVPNKKSKIQGLSIRSMEESAMEMPTLPREKPRRPDQEPEGSPTPPPRHLRSIPKHKAATDSIERLVPSDTKRNEEDGEGIINQAYKDEDKKEDAIGSTPSVHL